MDVSAFVLHGVEMTLGYQEPVLWPADLIFTAALLETKSVPKTRDVVWFLISPFEKQCVCWPGGACSALACVYFCLKAGLCQTDLFLDCFRFSFAIIPMRLTTTDDLMKLEKSGPSFFIRSDFVLNQWKEYSCG